MSVSFVQRDSLTVSSQVVYCFNSSMKLLNCMTQNYAVEFTMAKQSK